MRKYKNQDENQVLEIYCNCCGKKLDIFREKMENATALMCVKNAMTDGWLLFRFRWKRICKMSCCSTKKCVL